MVEADLGAGTDDPLPFVRANVVGRTFRLVVVLMQPLEKPTGVLRRNDNPAPSSPLPANGFDEKVSI